MAGSEKEDDDTPTSHTSARLEGSNINKSLLALGNCIKILSDKKSASKVENMNVNMGVQHKFVPYRDSKLTRLLKDSLGGNAKTLMLACIIPYYANTPSSQHYEATLNTLKYASWARRIENSTHRNVKGDKKSISKVKKLIKELKLEIQDIKHQIIEVQNDRSEATTLPVSRLPSRRNSCPNVLPNIQVDVDDLMDVLKLNKDICREQARLKTLRNFLSFEFIQLQKVWFFVGS